MLGCADPPRVPIGALVVRALVRSADVAVRAPEPVGVDGGDLVVSADGVVLSQLDAAADEADRARPERVVHQRVEVPALADALRSHAEELADGDDVTRRRGTGGGTRARTRRGSRSGNPAATRRRRTRAPNARADVEDVLDDARVVEVELGEVGEVPPALVVDVVSLDAVRDDGEGFGQEPILVRTLLLRVEEGREGPVAAAGVVEDAVEDEADLAPLALGDQVAEGVLAAEHRVHLREVARVVPVVRRAQKHRGEVEAVHAEGLDVVEVMQDAAQRTALERTDRGGEPQGSRCAPAGGPDGRRGGGGRRRRGGREGGGGENLGEPARFWRQPGAANHRSRPRPGRDL